MKQKSILLLCLFTTLLATGCATQQMYYWGNYSTTLYHFRKDANEESQGKHMVELEAIIKGSKENNLRVPPGVYCELGYMYVKKGNKNQAMELFALEKSTYPESTHFIDRLVESIKAAEDANKKPVDTETKKIEG